MSQDRQQPKIIAAALIEKGGKLLLIKEKLASGKEKWIVPGGAVEFGENLEEAVKREIKEETGLDVKITKFIGFKEVIAPQFDYHTIVFFYLAEPIGGSLVLEDDQILDGNFFSPEEIKNLLLVDSAQWVLKKMKVL